MEVGKYKYKLIVNSNSIEVFEYHDEKNFISKDGEIDDIDYRMKFGMKKDIKHSIQRIVDDDTGEIIEKKLNELSSLDDKLEYNLINANEYNERKLKSLKDSRRRAITELRRKIDNNLHAWGEKPKFITLTYSYQEEDRERSYKHFKEFIKKLNYHMAKTFDQKKKQWLKWVAVIEHQKNGRIHYHTLFFNLPFVKFETFDKCWTYGRYDLKAVDTSKDNRKLIKYLLKYIVKEQAEDNEKSIKEGKLIAENKRFYLSSKGLLKEKEVLLTGDEEELLKSIIGDYDLQFEKSFNNKFTGEVMYKQYYKD